MNNVSFNAISHRPVISSGLIAWWKFNEGTGKTVYNSSKNYYTGSSFNSPLWINGFVSNALLFNGTTQYVSTSITNLNYSSGTITWWMYPTTYYDNGVDKTFWSQNYAQSNAFAAEIYTDSNWYVGWVAPSNDARVTLAATLSNYPLNTWAFYTFTWNSAGSILYFNGNQIGSNSSSPSVANLSVSFFIGGNNTVFLAGAMQDFRIYNRVLSSSEILQIYNIQG